MTDPAITLADQLVNDPAFAPHRAQAIADARAQQTTMIKAFEANDRRLLASFLAHGSADRARVDFALMHVRVCADCTEIEAILVDGAAAIVRQMLSWYGFFAIMRHTSSSPSTAAQLERLLTPVDPAILSHVPAALADLGAAGSA